MQAKGLFRPIWILAAVAALVPLVTPAAMGQVGNGGIGPGSGGTRLKDLAWDLDMGYSSALPTGVDLEWVGSQGDGELYRQTHLGIPIWGSQVAYFPQSPRSAAPWVSYRLYPREKLLELEDEMRGAAIPRGDAIAAASAELPGGTYEAELAVYPQRNLPVLVWAVEHTGPNTSPFVGGVAFIDSRDGSVEAVLMPQVDELGTVSAGGGGEQGAMTLDIACPSPNGAFRHALGTGVKGGRWCFPVKVELRGQQLLCYTDMIANEGRDDEIRTYRNDGSGLDLVSRNQPSVNAQCQQGYYDDFGEELELEVNAHAFFWRVNEYFKDLALGLGQAPAYPRDGGSRTEGIRVETLSTSTAGTSAYDGGSDVFLVRYGRVHPRVSATGSQIDITGHEYAHAVALALRATALEETWEKSINEAVADVLGIAAEAAIEGRRTQPDWLLAEGAGEGSQAGKPLRNLKDPHQAENPWNTGHSPSDHLLELQADSFFIHNDATILGLAFHLLAEGGGPPRPDVFPAPAVSGIGIDRAVEILYLSLRHLVPGTDHCSFGESLVTTTRHLYQDDPLLASTVTSLRAALRAVGVVDHLEIRPDEPAPVTPAAGESAFFKLPKAWSGVRSRISEVRFELTVPDHAVEATVRLRQKAYPSPTETCEGCQLEVAVAAGSAVGGVRLARFTGDESIGEVACRDRTESHTLDVYLEVEAGSTPLPSGSVLTVSVVNPKRSFFGTRETDLSGSEPVPVTRLLRVPTPKGPEALVVTIEGGSGDADLYLARDRVPTPDDYDLRATGPGTRHYVRELSADPGDYYIAIYGVGVQGFAGVELLATLGERPPRVTRNQASYNLCDTARMTLETFPPQANRTVYGWRLFNGQVERYGEPIDTTDGSGRLVREVLLTDPAFCGRYDDEQFAVGSPEAPRSDPLGYVFDCEPIQPCPM